MADDTPDQKPIPPVTDAPTETDGPQRRLGRFFPTVAKLMRSGRLSRAQVLAAVLVAALGFALVAQLRQTEEQGLATLRQSDLIRILDDVGDRRDRLASEASDLEVQRRELTDVRTGAQAALAAAQQRATTLGILAGTVAAHGPGVEVYITDPDAALRAATMLDLVQELRDAGAEAIQIGSARVVASTSFSDVKGGLAVDAVVLQAPYVVRAIGDGQTMATALEIPGGVVAGMPTGSHTTVAVRDDVDITALHAVPRPQYAQPAVTATPSPSSAP